MRRARKIKGEGWDVFESSGSRDGSMQICRVDDPGSSLQVENDPHWEGYDGPITPAFAADSGAIRHVIRLAKLGDKQALDALWAVLPYDGLVNRILWCEAMGWTGRDAADYPVGYYEAWGHLWEENEE
jgi:hypothetical protein